MLWDHGLLAFSHDIPMAVYAEVTHLMIHRPMGTVQPGNLVSIVLWDN